MAAATTTSYSAFLKQIWPLKTAFAMWLAASPTWGVLEKDTKWVGSKYNVPMAIGRTTGLGGTGKFTVAQNNKNGTASVNFALDPATFYSLLSIDRLLMKRSENEEGAVKTALGFESKAAFEAWARCNSLYLFGNGGGALAQIATVTGAVITFTKPGDTRAFEKGMYIETSTADGTSGSVKPNPGVPQIAAIDRDAGTITAVAAWSTLITGVAANDFVFIQGTFGVVAKGFAAWLPATAPTTGDNFWGVDRSVDPTRLAGLRYVGTGKLPRTIAYEAAMKAFSAGAKPNLYVLGTDDFTNLQSDLQSVGSLVNTKTPNAPINEITFGVEADAISFLGPAGKIDVICDYNLSQGTGYMLQRDTWKIASIGNAPYFDTFGGGSGDPQFLKEPNSDSYEGRVVGDWQLACLAPGYNVRVTL